MGSGTELLFPLLSKHIYVVILLRCTSVDYNSDKLIFGGQRPCCNVQIERKFDLKSVKIDRSISIYSDFLLVKGIISRHRHF
jgi:hypothetical protein